MERFEKGINRKGTNCVKWDVPFVTEGVQPMWIADMDFEVAPAITENLKNITSQGAFGYQFLSENYYQSIINWMERRHRYKVAREEICYVPNVVLGLSFAVQAVSEPGDEIIIQTPVYGPFFRVMEDNQRVLVESKLKEENGYYTMDMEDFERKITPKTKAVILCNPHNPSGRVWTKEELEQLAEICMRHHLYIISDDIHCELVRAGQKHTFISSLSEEVRRRSIICTSPSKAFNLAGIHVANCFISDEELRGKFMEIAEKSHAAESNAFVEAALRGAYDESEEWLLALNDYLDQNIDYFVSYIEKEISGIKVRRPEGTYLVWADCRKLGIKEERVREFLLDTCKIAVNDGEFFGKEGRGFVRFNLACPLPQIKGALENLKKGIETL